MDTPQAFDSAINRSVTELPTAKIEIQLPKVPDYEWTKKNEKDLREAAEAMAAHEDNKILEALHTPPVIRKATPEGLKEIDKKLRNNEFVMLAGSNPYHEKTPPLEEEE